MKVKNIILFGLFAFLTMSCSSLDKQKADLNEDLRVSPALKRAASRL